MWCLVSENLSGLGGPMGSGHTSINFRKYFKTLKNAQIFAQEDYGRSIINWKTKGNESNYFTSGDLGFVMYSIIKVKTTD